MANPAIPDFEDGVSRLVELGLTMSEARCYVALLHVAPATASELAEVSGVARPKVYGTLKSLEQRSFCYPSGDRVMTYRPVDPELALEEWIRVRRHERRLTDERDVELHRELVRLLPAPPEPDAGGAAHAVMELYAGASEAIAKVESLIREAQRRVDIILSAPVIQAEDRWNRFEIEALERGVQVRLLFVTRELAERHRYHELLAAGGEVRVAREAPVKVLIRDDGAEAAVALRDPSDDGHQIFLTIRHADLVAPLQLLFNREWRRANPLGEPRVAAAAQRGA